MDITPNQPKQIFTGPKPPVLPSSGKPSVPPGNVPKKPISPSMEAVKPALVSKTPPTFNPKDPTFSKSAPALPPKQPNGSKPLPGTAVPAKPQSESSVASGQVAIHTMKDDIASLRRPVGAAPVAPKTAVTAPKKTGGEPFSRPIPSSTIPVLPLPESQGGKSVVIPAEKSASRSWAGVLTTVIIVLLALLIAGGAVWYFMGGGIGEIATNNESQTSINDMIPAQAQLVVAYQINDSTRDKINLLWAQQSTKQPTLDSLLEGDPRMILQNSDVGNIYYVQLKDESRPFLIAPNVTSISSLFSNTASSQMVVKNGWRVVHPISLESYNRALSAGSVSSSNISTLLSNPSVTEGVQIYVSSEQVKLTIERQLGVTLGTYQGFPLSVKSGITQNAITFSGIAQNAGEGKTISTIDLGSLDMIPANIGYLYSGNNISSDIQQWGGEKSVLSGEIINRPAAQQLLKGLDGQPFTLYSRKSTDINSSYGLLIKITDAQERQLKADISNLETVLFSLTPLITKNSTPLTTLPLFADGSYADVPLRYVNINGANAALDYAFYQGHLLIATSKDAMFELINAATKKSPSLLQSNPQLSQGSGSQQLVVVTKGDAGFNNPFIIGLPSSAQNSVQMSFTASDTQTDSITGTYTP